MTLEEIIYELQVNPAGILPDLLIADADTITNDLFPLGLFNSSTPFNDTGADEITLSGSWLPLKLLFNNNSFQENNKETPNGDTFDMVLKGLLPGDSAHIRNLLDNMKHYRYVLLYRCRDYTINTYRLVGSKEYPLKLTSIFSSGEKAGDMRGHSMTFSVTAPFKSRFYKLT